MFSFIVDNSMRNIFCYYISNSSKLLAVFASPSLEKLIYDVRNRSAEYLSQSYAHDSKSNITFNEKTLLVRTTCGGSGGEVPDLLSLLTSYIQILQSSFHFKGGIKLLKIILFLFKSDFTSNFYFSKLFSHYTSFGNKCTE